MASNKQLPNLIWRRSISLSKTGLTSAIVIFAIILSDNIGYSQALTSNSTSGIEVSTASLTDSSGTSEAMSSMPVSDSNTLDVDSSMSATVSDGNVATTQTSPEMTSPSSLSTSSSLDLLSTHSQSITTAALSEEITQTSDSVATTQGSTVGAVTSEPVLVSSTMMAEVLTAKETDSVITTAWQTTTHEAMDQVSSMESQTSQAPMEIASSTASNEGHETTRSEVTLLKEVTTSSNPPTVQETTVSVDKGVTTPAAIPEKSTKVHIPTTTTEPPTTNTPLETTQPETTRTVITTSTTLEPTTTQQPTTRFTTRMIIPTTETRSTKLIKLLTTTTPLRKTTIVETKTSTTSQIVPSSTSVPKTMRTTSPKFSHRKTTSMPDAITKTMHSAPPVVSSTQEIHIANNDTERINATMVPPAEGGISSSLIGIIVGSIVGFWVILGPIICIACRLRDKAKERRLRYHRKDSHISNFEDMIMAELEKAQNRKRENGYSYGDIKLDFEETQRLSGNVPVSEL